MADWVKLDPLQMGEWLAPLRTSRERGEWVTGLQAGALGALLRIGASEAEASGHAAGMALLAAKTADKASVSDLQRARANARWKKNAAAQSDVMPRHELGIDPAIPREERRGEENFPQGGNGDPSPSNEIPVWKVIQSERENKAESARRKIADLRPSVERWEAMGDRLKPDAKERLEKARTEIRTLETEIYGYGIKP